MRVVRYAGLLAASLAVAACGRGADVADVDHAAVCRSAAAIAQVEPMILKSAGLGGHSGASPHTGRPHQAQVELSDLRLTDYDAGGDMATCAATARLDAPILGSDAVQASQSIAYVVRQRADGAVEVVSVQAAEGGGKPFATLVQADRRPPATPHPLAPAPVAPVETSLSEPDAGPPHRPAPVLSDDAQQLVDQAGDSRTVTNSEADDLASHTASPTTSKEQGL